MDKHLKYKFGLVTNYNKEYKNLLKYSFTKL